jgi:hypothetical protein
MLRLAKLLGIRRLEVCDKAVMTAEPSSDTEDLGLGPCSLPHPQGPSPRG